ncbi:TonB-dependent receptor plug domain-containing protein [Pasteurella multocida]|uniref:TonB-dependent receptor plug domain-containing protein n=1 Tax=Pasteurella multocida TaxID=747 RepID=UPI00397AB42F
MESAKNPLKKTTLALLCCSTAFSLSAKTDTNADKNHFLTEIVVYADQNKSMSSTQSVTQDDMKKSPVTNGNITDYLRSNPHVRYENSDQNGLQQGEIKPENISINGADYQQTTFFVDNVNINNDMGFGSDLFDGTMATVPFANHSQGYFFDANLLSSIVVHDSNVSASLGGFAGGAVVAKTKQYDGKDRLKFSYRTTDASWAKFKVEDKDLERFKNAIPEGSVAEFQPKYSKHFFNITAEKGLSENLGMVIGLSRRTSSIQQSRQINPQGDRDKQTHTRRSDNALLNFNLTPNDKHRFELGFRYSNYRERKFFNTNIDSNVFDYHRAYGVTFSWINALQSGILTTTLAYDNFDDTRKSASTYMKTTLTDDGEEYTEGGMGNSQLNQKNLHTSLEYAMNPFNLGSIEHSVSLGGIYQATKYRFTRHSDAVGELYTPDWLDNNSNGIYDELTLAQRNIAKKGTVKTRYQNIALYVEDLMTWKNLEFRAGLRLERDDYLKNTNLAPRTVFRYKPFEDTAFSVGWNRYYGRSFASMKLSEGIFKLDGHDTFRYKDLSQFKTPYSDELSFGVEQYVANLAFHLKYILRDNKQRIVLQEEDVMLNGEKKKLRYYQRGKDYKTNVLTFQISTQAPWEFGPTRWTSALAFDWLDSKAIDHGRGYNGSTPVILDGKLMTYEQMLKKVNAYKETWGLRLNLDMFVPKFDLSWANTIYVKPPTTLTERVSSNTPEVYRSYDYGTYTQWDTSLRWQPTFAEKHRPYIKLDVLNVLNKTRKGAGPNGQDLGIYTPGREFWLEVGYEF